ncbi:IPT/TIG domain-containing protein [Bradyrhizobium japonicum]|uniref:IPT/TIG domain-containing protein n=1 Tax=Bradyrhizobium japonicum TaxID=375 RepID=UPI001E3E84FF|nr:IPT/TIG domain-containing protein [Bradyrhizobium japonicum]MCD9823574.1 IPT/TIG domain-containing protein [Bradyrhizobium japonicum]MEB2674972.1 IPT/TIG domain-containing protein [Bradyrhizobium japonicum]WLB33357.1 IPT/TIG domain-containing protein [Bradyrhizobium japonicum]WRI94119.1 IPT/TIG domain-containing protein [Bradyrhizobium japonicum]WRJ79934.1 IPT/TIG domain-containing protein [Bradyrhizobium japonicum]
MNFTSVGQVYRLCFTVGTASAPADDSVVWGLFSVPGTDSFYNAPIANSSGTNSGNQQLTAADYNPTTAKATYTFHPTNPNQNGQNANAGQAEIDITLNSKTGSGAETITLYYAPGCSDFTASCSGSSIANTSFVFTINLPSPTVTSISPTSGPLAGGTSVVITGTNFTGTTGAGGVKFGATNATSYTVNSNTQITATAPAGSAGAVDVTVTNGSTSPTSAADQFTYVAAPTVTSISPTSGPTGGGTSVIITGTNFSTTTGAAGVKFGATNAASYTVNSNTQITATAPAGTGTVDVTVTTVGGTSATTASDQFTYVAAPTVTSISPTTGPGGGGTTVTITGTNFTGATAVTFGATAAAGFTVNSATQITATSPAGTSTVDVRVTTAGGTSATSAADQFTYIAAPAVTSISPTTGPAAGGTSVTITGTNFTGVTAVSFGGTAAAGFTFNSATSITATSPAGTGVVDVRVTTPGGTSAISAADHFTYAGPPSVTSISPTGGPLAGGTIVTITGANLSGATAVTFGATAAAGFTVNSATQITATSPAGTGTVDVRVTTVGGTSASSAADQFSYAATPAVTSVAPNAGSTTGGTSVTITGTALSGATAVKFGATNATSFTVNSATSITAVSPAGAGTVDITVTTPAGTSATSASDQFSYTPAPTVGSISPNSGSAIGGISVAITGTGFTGATAVKFGANNATSFTVNSATSITATSPPGAGTVDVTVTTGGGTSPTSAADRFTYLSATTTTELTSSKNPSSYGESVTFTAKVNSLGGTPTGTVTFNDGGTPIGTSTLSAGDATFATTTLAVGNHSITATYNGSVAFNASTSPALNQSVDIPADSAKLRALQLNVTKIVAQSSGQAISGSIDTAISEGFSDGGQYITPGAGGLRVNFAAAPDGDEDDKPKSGQQPGSQSLNAYSGDGGPGRTGGRGRGSSRIDDAFAAIDRAAPTKAPAARFREQKDWLFWIDVRGTGIDQWGSSGNIGQGATQATLFGQQINLMSGLTYRARPNLLVGVTGGYENFSYTQTDINGKLKGDGWTVGAYLGWKIIPTLRYDVAVTYSGIGYDGTAGTAQGNFNGNRWIFATGFTGSYSWANFNIEPSAKVYAIWERENAYVDSLGTQQAARTFSSGRASAGNRVSYPVPWLDSVLLVPYAGVFADYYFTQDDAAAIVAAGGIPLASTPLLQGWSARVTGGIGARLAGGTTVGFGAELGGIGSNTQIWTFTGRARIPF